MSVSVFEMARDHVFLFKARPVKIEFRFRYQYRHNEYK